MAIVDVEASLSGDASVTPDASTLLAAAASLSPDASLAAAATDVVVFWEVFDPKDTFTAKNPTPLLRQVKYRAKERLYSALLNDPNLLVLNSPKHKIGYPPLFRPVNPSFVPYEATALPENDATFPWERKGTGGTASIVGDTLVLSDTSTGTFPSGQPLFWTRPLDVSFDHVFAMAWRFRLDLDVLDEGVFTGIAAGYTDADHGVVVGFLDDAGTKKIGLLKKDFGDNPSGISAWAGGLTPAGVATGAPVAFDWSTLHSYRIFRDKTGVVKVFVDGNVIETLRLNSNELPEPRELASPLDAIQGVFFGSLSRPAKNDSTWDFVRYQIVPTNPFQTAPSSFVSYEGTASPEAATPSWTAVGYHGTETILGGSILLVDSTSATTPATSEEAGLLGGDFRGYVRLEPMLAVSSDVVLDVNVQLRTLTHGIAPNAAMAAIDDGNRLVHLCFFPDATRPKFSYGGRSLPEDSTPVAWSSLGTAPVAMAGRLLRISDTSATDGRVYYVDDNAAVDSPLRVAGLTDYAYEFRVKVNSFTPDGSGFCGVGAQVFDGAKSVGLIFEQISGVRYVTLASDGVATPGTFAFEWNDGKFHTYKVVRSLSGSLVSVFVDAVFLGSLGYTQFSAPGSPPAFGVYSFGSSTAASNASLSVVDWAYFNVWRTTPAVRKYAGLWKGYDSDSLTGYHLPLKTSGRRAWIAGSVLEDPTANFTGAGVVPGDRLIIDIGPNRGVYGITSVLSPTTLAVATLTGQASTVNVEETVTLDDLLEVSHSATPALYEVRQTIDLPVRESLALSGSAAPSTVTPFPLTPTEVGYRIPKETDWATAHRYRIVRDPGGGVSVFLDNDASPMIRVGYNEIDLPSVDVGILRVLGGGLPCLAFGAFDPTNISQMAWDYVRYGITRSQTERRIAPHHQVLNQRNLISSPEHLAASVAHAHTGYWSSSTGIPPQTDPDFLRNTSVPAHTQLNDGTPPMLLTQTSEIRQPVAVIEPLSTPATPADVLQDGTGFVLNDSATRIKLLVPDDVLYNSLQLFETGVGETKLLAPFTDRGPQLGTLSFTNEVCLTYDGSVLPEASNPGWVLASDDPLKVSAAAASGVLTYGTTGGGTRTLYRNDTPLLDVISLPTEVSFRIRLANDASGGAGDSQVRFGFSAPGMTVALGLMTMTTGQRYAVVLDLVTNAVLGGLPFDFLDGAYHTYKITRNPTAGTVDLAIDV